MKKVLAGCLIVLVVALIGFAVAGFYAYRLAAPMLENAGDYVARAREMSRLGDAIVNQDPFVPPANGQLNATQVERFIAVQGRVRSELGTRWGQIEAKSAEIRKRTEGNRRDLTMSEVTSVFSDLATIYIDARRAQVTALNTQRFSDAEYGWVRRRVWEAAGVQVASGLDLSAVEALARQGEWKVRPEMPAGAKPDVPATNVALIKPHIGQLKEWVAMALLGL